MAIEQWLRRSAPYAWSVLATGVAALARMGLAPFLGDADPLGTFYAAVALVGWFLGVRPALLSAILGYPIGVAWRLRRRQRLGDPIYGRASGQRL